MTKSHKTCMEQAEIIDMFGTYQAHKTVNIGKQSTSKHSITTEHHMIKKASHDTAMRYGSIVENGY